MPKKEKKKGSLNTFSKVVIWLVVISMSLPVLASAINVLL